jgi:hypothetical protein
MSEEDGQDPRARVGPPHHRAEIVFGLAAFGLALVLLARLGAETRWVAGQPLVAQPAFWPAVAIIGMTLFGALELVGVWRRNAARRGRPALPEVAVWLRALEFAAWFMVYVWAVPWLGYLPATLVFCTALTLRLGYRSRRMIGAALLTGLATVVVFKSLLAVKIPGGAVYEYLPAGLRNFMILYL